jgi:ABC-type antimicrobial peptide transport system permease subunit
VLRLAPVGRLIRQLLIETVALFLGGGLAGIGIAAGTAAVLVRSNAQGTAPYINGSKSLPHFWPAAPDGRILLFAFAISILTALCFGLGPAFGGTRVSLASTLREEAAADRWAPAGRLFAARL